MIVLNKDMISIVIENNYDNCNGNNACQHGYSDRAVNYSEVLLNFTVQLCNFYCQSLSTSCLPSSTTSASEAPTWELY